MNYYYKALPKLINIVVHAHQILHFETNMTIPQQIQPNLPNGFGAQFSISSQLFNLVLNTARTRQEFERAWEALAQQEELIDQIRNARQQNYIYIYSLTYLYYILLL